MGMFDHVRCNYPLPDKEANALDFQTKSMPISLLDNFEITADGKLQHEAYESGWIDDASAPFGGYIERKNLRWEPVNFRGELEIHTSHDGLWYSYLLWFKNGCVADLQHGSGHGEPIPRVVNAAHPSDGKQKEPHREDSV